MTNRFAFQVLFDASSGEMNNFSFWTVSQFFPVLLLLHFALMPITLVHLCYCSGGQCYKYLITHCFSERKVTFRVAGFSLWCCLMLQARNEAALLLLDAPSSNSTHCTCSSKQVSHTVQSSLHQVTSCWQFLSSIPVFWNKHFASFLNIETVGCFH